MSGEDMILLVIAVFALYYLLTGSCNKTKEGFMGPGAQCRKWSIYPYTNDPCNTGSSCSCTMTPGLNPPELRTAFASLASAASDMHIDLNLPQGLISCNDPGQCIANKPMLNIQW